MYSMPHESVNDVEFYANCGCDERIYLIEECAELIQACTKYMRKSNNITKMNLAEEMAHVYLTLNHVREQYGVSVEDIQYFIDKKLEERPII